MGNKGRGVGKHGRENGSDQQVKWRNGDMWWEFWATGVKRAKGASRAVGESVDRDILLKGVSIVGRSNLVVQF